MIICLGERKREERIDGMRGEKGKELKDDMPVGFGIHPFEADRE